MKQVRLDVVDREGLRRELRARTGETLMTVLRDDIDVAIGTCGGVISCGTCRVFLDGDWVARAPAADTDEVEMLDALGDEPGARLACQLVLTEALDGLSFTIAPDV